MQGKIGIDTRGLGAAIIKYSAAAKMSIAEAIEHAARQVAQHAQKETVLQTGRGTRARASTAAQAKREQIELWKTWILKMGFPRMGYSSHRKTDWRARSMKSPALREYWFSHRMPSVKGLKGKAKKSAVAGARGKLGNNQGKTREEFFAEAKRRQGELAAGWNKAIEATGGKYVAGWVKRHGGVHGMFSRRITEQKAFAKITFEVSKVGSRGELRGIAQLAVKKTLHGLNEQVKGLVSGVFSKKRRKS